MGKILNGSIKEHLVKILPWQIFDLIHTRSCSSDLGDLHDLTKIFFHSQSIQELLARYTLFLVWNPGLEFIPGCAQNNELKIALTFFILFIPFMLNVRSITLVDENDKLALFVS
jgi:hypothetical protein